MRRGAIHRVLVCAAAWYAVVATAGVSLGQAAYTWEWPGGNAATGTWSERVGGAGTNLRYWKRNGAATAVLPGANDTVVITSPTNGVGQVNFDGTGFNAGTGQIAHVFRSFEVRPLNTMRINHTQGVSLLYIRATVGDLVIGSNGALEDAILRGDQVNAGVNNVPGCEVSLESVAQVRVAGRVYGGAPKGNANNTLRGGNVKLVSTRNGGVGVQVTGHAIAGNGADNTSSPGGNVVVQADTADLDLLRSNRAIWAGRGGNNTIGANGGAGGSVTIRSGRAISLGSNNPGDLATGWIFGGDGGSGLGTGGAGGNVSFQGGNIRAASLEVKFTALVFAGTGGRRRRR
ncbi:MAG: hypothetical protein HRU70_01025 [Phycisphaeraceae bacterium]|nr:MAG: hypothetical protein HRU70_01025 [Phycisphaeraceae bacterium]